MFYMVLNTRVSYKNFIHISKYVRCKTSLINISVENDLINCLSYVWNAECGIYIPCRQEAWEFICDASIDYVKVRRA